MSDQRTNPAIIAEALRTENVRARWAAKLRTLPSGCVTTEVRGRFHIAGELPQGQPRRVAWFYAHGEWITDPYRLILQTCETPNCLNIEHLYIASDEARFWAHVDRNGPVPMHRPELGPCWLWTGTLVGKGTGYGQHKIRGRAILAHRYSFDLHHDEPLPPHLHACHHCDNPTCVRPEHLFAGTDADNKRDCIVKGRHARGEALSRAIRVARERKQAS